MKAAKDQSMKNILIAYDGSPGAESAVKNLLRAGLPEHIEAKVLTIADAWLPSFSSGETAFAPELPEIEAARKKSLELLRDARKTAVQGALLVHQLFPEWNVANLAQADSPAWGIIQEAAKWPADLIVIGSHSLTLLEKFFIGSVSYKVAAEAGCSVRVARPRCKAVDEPLRIIAALDGSEDARHAADAALRRRWGIGTRIDLVTVIDARMKSRALAESHPTGNPSALDRIEDAAASLAREARARHDSAAVEVHSHILEGDPKSALLRLAAEWQADCVFMGAHGTDHRNGKGLGTVASAICARAQCTVEIARPSRREQSGPAIESASALTPQSVFEE